MKVLAIVNSLDRGGAEINLLRLAARLATKGIQITVLPLRRGGALSAEAREAGIEILGGGVVSLVRALWRPPARIVEGWLYVGAVAATCFRVRHCSVVWNLRHVPANLAAESIATRVCLWLMRRLPSPTCIHANSHAAIERHVALGIAGNYRYMPNGIDTERFRRDRPAARRFRDAVGIPESGSLVVCLGRAHRHKGHSVLFEAMGPVMGARPDLHLACIGSGVTALRYDDACRRLPANRLLLFDAMEDVVGPLSAADVVVSASLTESSPTSLAEAMSCSAVCVATNVGDSALLLGDTGLVVRPNDAVALGAAVEALFEMPAARRVELGERARQRVVEAFDLASCSDAYAASMLELADGS